MKCMTFMSQFDVCVLHVYCMLERIRVRVLSSALLNTHSFEKSALACVSLITRRARARWQGVLGVGWIMTHMQANPQIIFFKNN
jgi:hypothetical protein